MHRRTLIFPHRITCSHLILILVLLGAAVVASQVLAQPDRGSARSATNMYQENNAKLVYSPAWKTVRDPKCFGGLMRKRTAAGSVTAAFTGTGVSVYVTKGRAYGIMNVTLDGVAQKSVSLYAATKAYRRKAFSKTGLANGTHTLTVSWAGKKVAAASAKTINLDALGIQGRLIRVTAPTPTPTPTPTVTPTVLPGTTYQEADTRLRYLGVWSSADSASFSGGRQNTVNGPGYAIIDFNGTQAYVLATKGPAYGMMTAILDGVEQPTIDLYAATAKYQQAVFNKSGLSSAAHRLVLGWANSKNASASAKTINIDAVGVVGSLLQAPDMTGGLVGTWAFADYDWAESYAFRADGTYTRVIQTNLNQGNDGLFVHNGLYATYYDTARGSWILGLFYRTERFTPEGGPDGTPQPLADVEHPYYINGSELGIREYSSSTEYTHYYKQ